jgi:hypothetical protein
MKKIIFALTIATIFSFINFQPVKAQNALSAYGGYSWNYGAIGGEFRSGKWGFNLGVMPTSMPMSGDPVSAWAIGATWYGDTWDFSSMYINLAYNFAGYREETTRNGSYTSKTTEGMPIFTCGYYIPFWNSRLFVKAGIGYGYHNSKDFFTFDVLFGVNIFGN